MITEKEFSKLEPGSERGVGGEKSEREDTINHKLTAEELAELNKKPNRSGTECRPNAEVPEPSIPIKYFLFIEDGSVDLDKIEDDVKRRNPEIKVIIYRQGARTPELKEVE